MTKKVFAILSVLHPLFAHGQNNNVVWVEGQSGTRYGIEAPANTVNPFVKALLSERYGYGKIYDNIKVRDYYLEQTEVSIHDYQEFIKDFTTKLCYQISDPSQQNLSVINQSSTPLKDKLDLVLSKNSILKSFYDIVVADKSKSFSIQGLRVNIKSIYENEKVNATDKNTLYFVFDGERDQNLKEVIIGDYKPGRSAPKNDILSFLGKELKLSHISPGKIEKNKADIRLLFYLLPFVESQQSLDDFYVANEMSNKYPVFGVDYYCAMFYAAWYDKRLPTELEFETAGKFNPKNKRGERLENRNFPVQFKEIDGVYRLLANYWHEQKIGSDYKSVDDEQYKQNGFYHLVGNVAEWMVDFYDTNPYVLYKENKTSSSYEATFKYFDEQLKLGFDKQDLLSQHRSVRGGDYNSVLFYLRIQTRLPESPYFRSATIGFRCATF